MKQGIRLLVKPGSFFNQLQWSSHHWFLLLGFLSVATIETHIGRQAALYEIYANWLVNRFGLGWDSAIWLVTSAKLGLMVVGAFALASLIWAIGNIFGRKTSKRVLFRRLAVVFTVLLAGYTANHMTDTYPVLGIVSLCLYVWGVLLGYFAIREQFALNHMETVVLGLFALLLVTSSWHFSNHMIEAVAKRTVSQKTAPMIVSRPARVE